MRKAAFFAMDHRESLECLDRAEVCHLSSTTPEGRPVLRALHVVRLGESLYFHAAPIGEKSETVGRFAIVSAEEDLARVPSTFLDPERACPATTLYRSVQVEGMLVAVHDPDEKARVLEALMKKLQPEGGYVPIDPSSALYEKAVASIAVVKLVPELVTGKKKLAQNRTPEDRRKVYEGFFRRGHDGDFAALEAVLEANPQDEIPAFLRAKDGTRLLAHLPDRRLPEAARLLEAAYWLEGVSAERIEEGFRRSRVRVAAVAESGELLGVARATSDGRVAWIFDVMVAQGARGRGLGRALVELLLAHPAVDRALVVRLGTRDAMGLYEKLGFVDVARAPLRAYRTVEMARRRA
jgi:nitroimidazol reductase NimA-like FMN-containing flavoprotein (pyridoxamine 5'-phosphate oxidase superfamily)/ribosomal protein S18 acetylase RimI-like enzyme